MGNELGGTFSARATALESEQEAQRLTDPAAGRVWKVTNPGVQNAWGDPVAYKLAPGPTRTHGPARLERGPAGLHLPHAISGSPGMRRTSDGPLANTPTSTWVGAGSPDGRRPTDP